MALTTDQARTIADAFLEAANVIDKYLDNNFKQISRAEYEFLNESFTAIPALSS